MNCPDCTTTARCAHHRAIRAEQVRRYRQTGTSITRRPRPAAGLDWMDDASCKGHDTNAFVPDKDNHNTPMWQRADVLRALELCETCPVRLACLEYALEVGDTIANGVYGGTTNPQRRAIRNRRDRTGAA